MVEGTNVIFVTGDCGKMKEAEIRTVAVSNPGGRAPHFRVQVRGTDHENWRHSAVFGNRQLADQFARELEQGGLQSRVVHFRLPSAA